MLSSSSSLSSVFQKMMVSSKIATSSATAGGFHHQQQRHCVPSIRTTTTRMMMMMIMDRGFTTTTTPQSAEEESSPRPPVPPFSYEDAVLKVRMAENAWNTRDPDKVKMAYTLDTKWRNRSQFLIGREQVKEFLSGKWEKELDYRLIKEIWCHDGNNRIAVRFCYEYQDAEQNNSWFRAYGNENWEFDNNGLMKERHASINDIPIQESERLFHWDRSAPRPDDHPGLSELGL